MATILDQLITSPGLDFGALSHAAQQEADGFAALRRETMGALALFTGGKSLAGLSYDITQVTASLGEIARSVEIAPQTLLQLRQAAQSVGVAPGDVDTLFYALQALKVTSEGRATLAQASQQLGVELLDDTARVRGDVLDQLHASPRFREQSQEQQSALLHPIGGSAGIVTLVTAPSYTQLVQKARMSVDWATLQETADAIMAKVFRDIEPSLDNFAKALNSLETVSSLEGLERGENGALLASLSAMITARGVVSSLTSSEAVSGLHETGEQNRPLADWLRHAIGSGDGSLSNRMITHLFQDGGVTGLNQAGNGSFSGENLRGDISQSSLAALRDIVQSHLYSDTVSPPVSVLGNGGASVSAGTRQTVPTLGGEEALQKVIHSQHYADTLYSMMVDRLAQLSDSASVAAVERAYTTNNTTNSPVITINVSGTNGTPEETANTIRTKLANAFSSTPDFFVE
ncbi:hypothetical protein GS501_04970 [Saccharibacter sp. 17.LH.SD]|uniref:hypothetical protein n=1 Tax=Saccharibacter sp. 17.LH.SD TaxID=2689393 RepID=UPI00136A948C|nr:hypothetical protein [Saccharibacter sp. 17.LH.SD]MXV44399.1 hypothetical protein [Saccharibacter sp. 17.LH.SD]